MVQYLKNDICKLTPLFKINYKKKQNIVSSVFFKLKGGGYKNFDKYLNGIKYLNKYVNEVMDDFQLRLFIDKSIYSDKKIMNYLCSLKINIILYDCPDYKINNKFHQGCFGTLVRFFPMFDFPNNDAGIVIPTDIDYKSFKDVSENHIGELYQLLTKIPKVKNTKSYYLIDGMLYNLWIKNLIDDNQNFMIYIVASKQLNYKRFDHNIISSFVKCVKSRKTCLTDYGINQLNHDTNFIFGVDEYFLNQDLINSIKKNNLPYIFRIKFGIIDYVYWNIFGFKTMKKEKVKEYKNFLNYVMPNIKIEETHKGIKDAYNQMDKFTFVELSDKKNLTKKQQVIFYKIYKYFIQIYDKSEVQFYGKEYLSIILSKEYIGKVFVKEIIFYNSDQKTIVEKEYKLIKEDIDKLKSMIIY